MKTMTQTLLLTLLLALLAGPSLARLSAEEAEQFYRQGQDALADGRYGDAAEQFRSLSEESGAQVDRAVYWLAYAEAKAGRKQAALESLQRLASDFPDSRWLDDARALQVELGGVEAARAAQTGDDDLKLYALDALMQADPERAVPLLRDFLQGDHSPRLKERALFVLSQTETPEASRILSTLARDAADPQLQREAIKVLGYSDHPSGAAELVKIYGETSDAETKRLVIHSLIASDDADAMAELARSETNSALRRDAINALGAMDAIPQLESLAAALGPEYRGDIYRAYGVAGDSAPLLRRLRQTSDPAETSELIDALVISGSNEATRTTLLELYAKTKHRSVKQKVQQYLMIEDEAEPLIEIFRTEKDPELKKEALRHLSLMDDPAVQELIERLLKG